MIRFSAAVVMLVATLSVASEIIEIPSIERIELDGALDEWTQRKPAGTWDAPNIVHGQANYGGAADLGGRCWLAWDAQFLYVAAEVIDDTHSQTEVADQMYRGDHVMMLIDADREGDRDALGYNADDFQIGLSPGSLKDTGDFLTRRAAEAVVWQPLYVQTPGINVAAKKTEKGYDLEAAIPWSFLGVSPSSGHVIGFDVNPSDNDSPEPVQQSLASLIEGAWTLGKTDRMLEGRLSGEVAPGTGQTVTLPAPMKLASEELLIAPGAEKPFSVSLPDGLKENVVPLLQFEARWAADKLSGASYGLVVSVNGKEVPFERIVDRPASVTFARGDAQPLSTNSGWTLFYSHDYEALHAQNTSEYFIPPGRFNGYRFTVDLSDLLQAGENTITLAHRLSIIQNDMAVRNVRLMFATPSQVKQMRSGETAGLRRTAVQVAPPAPLAPPQHVAFQNGGGIAFEANGRKWQVQSQFSEPASQWRTLSASPDKGWKNHARPDAQTFVASTDGFRLSRKLVVLSEGLEVREQIENLTDAPLPMMIRHTIDWPAGDVGKLTLNGRQLPLKRGISSNNQNPTLMIEHTVGGAIALTPVDDVMRVHHQGFLLDDKAGLADNNLVLAPKAKYEQVWQLYAVPSGNYWDMINAVRRTWNTNFKIEGGFAFIDPRRDFEQHTYTPDQWRTWLEKRAAIFPTLGMYHPFTGSAFHGLQFAELDAAAIEHIRQTIANIHAAGPQYKFLHYFHCFITGASAAGKADPKDMLLDAQGNQVFYSGDKTWPLFLPLENNDYGKQMEVQFKRMIEDLKFDGIYWDEHEYSYQDYHYGEPWDGYSGLIDPDTHELKRTRSHVTLLTQAWRQKLINWLVERGAPLVCNGAPATKSGSDARIMRFTETGSVTNLYNMHLYTPIGLADHTTERTHLDTIKQQMQFLDAGSLYYYYTARIPVENPGLCRWMYPITPIALGPGYILGQERILTTRPGRFSWGDATLPAFEVHMIDMSGNEVPADFATLEQDGKQWIELRLPENHAAAIVRGSSASPARGTP